MATQKKTTTRKTSGTTTGATGKRTAGKSAPPPKPIRREVGAVVCLLLGIFSGLGYFDIHALFIDLFCAGLKGLVGYGFYVAPPALLMASYILAFHRGRPVRLRLWCVLLTPVMVGAFIHLIFFQDILASGFAAVWSLWNSGVLVKSGGVLSGGLAQVLILTVSKIGGGLLLVLAQIVMCIVAFRITISEVVDSVRNHQRVEYEPQEEPVPAPKKVAKPTATRAAIDIPMDEGPIQPKHEEPPVKKERFFNRKSKVLAPDQMLTGAKPMEADEVALEPVMEVAEPAPQPQQEVVVEPVPIPVVAPPVEPPKVEVPVVGEKVTAKESQAAAMEVARDIEKVMEDSCGAPAYQYPPVSLLREGPGEVGEGANAELRMNQDRLSETIRSFGIEAKISDVTRGPSVTRYEVELDQGVRLNKLTNLADDIALALGATGVRIAPIPDKVATVGIEVPNKLVSPVQIHEVIDSGAFRNQSSKVSFAVGKDIAGNCIVGNIAKLPHLLIAGTTGSGKSVCTNSLIISMLYKSTPEEVRLIMVDPKMVELGIYNGIPHLLIPVVTDPKKAAGALQWAVTEMMKRYRSFAEVGVRDLASYNSLAVKTEGMTKMPQVVVVIDELADLMLVAAKEVEESICRVAQMGRASGMHLIIATQRPSADVITGLMKANIPSRIAFAVASALESRIILDTQGAEKLVGRGDMLYAPLGEGKPLRVQGCLISDEEVASVVEFVKRGGAADYDESIIHEIEQRAAEKDKQGKGNGGSNAAQDGDGGSEFDELLPAAVEVVLETGQASVSMLQRRLKLGYSRGARLVDQLEEKGIVGPFEGSKPRQLLITREQWQEMQFRQNMVDVPATAPQSPAPTMPPISEPVPEELEFEGDAVPQSRELPPF